MPIEVGSAGVPFLYVPLRSLDAARRAVLRMDLWSSLLADQEASSPFLLTTQTESPNATVHARMFGPALGVPEDPATGIGSGPLGGFLVRHGMLEGQNLVGGAVPHDTGEVSIVSEQGIEMGRPSSIEIRIAMDGEKVTGVRVGGHTVTMASGTMHL
ncbi:MAG: PhzF family phenazine biosynthesis isomerase [bacterium]